ncbi:sensor histidine kinase, partial [Actinoallomurus acaciae]
MSANQPETAAPRRTGRRGPKARVRVLFDALEHLVGGFGTALLAFAALLWLAVIALAALVGLGLPLAPSALRVVRSIAERERARLSRWGPEIIGPVTPPPAHMRAALADPDDRRETRWLFAHGTLGLLLGITAVTLVVYAVQDVTFPLWWRWLPADEPNTPTVVSWTVHDDAGALGLALLGVVLGVLFAVLGSGMARLQARPGRRLLPPSGEVDLSLRVAQLSATRAAALDAHATELRRIERSLHDGTQNRLVAVTVLLGATRRALARDPSSA